MNDVQAALGISQLKKIDFFNKKRHLIKKRYYELLKNLPLTLPYQDPKCFSSLHLYPILINLKKIKKKLYNYLISNNIGVNVHYIPAHTHSFIKKMGFKVNDFPVSVEYFKRTLSIPIFPDLKINNQKKICKLIANATCYSKKVMWK